MHRAMLGLLLRVLPLALLVGLADHALGPRIHERYQRVYEHVSGECRAIRKTPGFEHSTLCAEDRFGRSAFDVLKEAEAELARAKGYTAHDDDEAARASVDRALTLAHEIDLRPTFIGALVGARIVRGVLDFAEASPTVIDPRTAAARCELWVLAHPLTGERLARTWDLVREDDLGLVAEAWRADRAIDEDLRLSEAERAILAGDRGRCDRAAPRGLGPVYCARGGEIVTTARRLAKLRG